MGKNTPNEKMSILDVLSEKKTSQMFHVSFTFDSTWPHVGRSGNEHSIHGQPKKTAWLFLVQLIFETGRGSDAIICRSSLNKD